MSLSIIYRIYGILNLLMGLVIFFGTPTKPRTGTSLITKGLACKENQILVAKRICAILYHKYYTLWH